MIKGQPFSFAHELINHKFFMKQSIKQQMITNPSNDHVLHSIMTLETLEMNYWEADEFTAAIQDLKKVQKMLDEKPGIDLCKKIVENQVFSLDERHYFWVKLASLYYRSGKYRECLKIYKYKLYQVFNPRYLRAMGDCHRQLGQTKEALDYFGAALQISQSTKDDKLTAQILNSRGLAYLISKELLPLASKDFLKATYKDITNPLYYCNASLVFQQTEDTFNQIQYCCRADYLLANLNQLNCRLSESNINWIKERIHTFLEQSPMRKKRNSLKKIPYLQSEQPDIDSSQFFQEMLIKYELRQEYRNQKKAYPLNKQKKKRVSEIYQGMISFIDLHYFCYGSLHITQMFPWNRYAFVYKPSDVVKSITEETFLYPLPLCMKKSCFSSDHQFAWQLQLSCIQLLMNCRWDLVHINTDLFVDTLKSGFYDRKIFDLHSNSLRLYGEKLAYDLLFGVVATGDIYQGKVPTECTREELMQRLKSACSQIVRKDLCFQCGEEYPKH